MCVTLTNDLAFEQIGESPNDGSHPSEAAEPGGGARAPPESSEKKNVAALSLSHGFVSINPSRGSPHHPTSSMPVAAWRHDGNPTAGGLPTTQPPPCQCAVAHGGCIASMSQDRWPLMQCSLHGSFANTVAKTMTAWRLSCQRSPIQTATRYEYRGTQCLWLVRPATDLETGLN